MEKQNRRNNNKKINLICKARLKRYLGMSEEALKMARKNIKNNKRKEAEVILEMTECYIKDARHFQEKGHLVNAFAAINYAHGWLDAGARLGIFSVKDGRLFTIA